MSDNDFDENEEVVTPESNSLSFADLQPKEDLNFDLPDGSKIPFKQPETMSADDHARLISLEKRMEGVFAKMQKNFKDKEAVANYSNFTILFVRFILPDFPEALNEKLTAGQRMKIVSWWREHTGGNEAKKG